MKIIQDGEEIFPSGETAPTLILFFTIFQVHHLLKKQPHFHANAIKRRRMIGIWSNADCGLLHHHPLQRFIVTSSW